MVRPCRLSVGLLVGLALVVTGCGRAEVVSAFCADAHVVYDAAGSASERATSQLFLASARRDRTPVLQPSEGRDSAQRNPEHIAASAVVLSIEEEIRGHLERFTSIVEERPDCFSAAERADARRLRRSLDAQV